MEWIEIKKELPNIGLGVLISDGKDMASAERCKSHREDKLAWTGYGYGGYEWEFDFNEDEVTHWMPLPGLPKKEKKK